MQFNKYDKQKTRVKRLLQEYTRQLLNNDEFDWIKLKNVYDKTIKNEFAQYKIQTITRQRQFQQMTLDELNKLYEDAGITGKTVIEEEKALLDSCKNESGKYEDRSNAIKVIGNWRESLDLKPKQQQTTREETNYLSFIDKKQGKIEAKQVIKSIEQQATDNKPSEAND